MRGQSEGRGWQGVQPGVCQAPTNSTAVATVLTATHTHTHSCCALASCRQGSIEGQASQHHALEAPAAAATAAGGWYSHTVTGASTRCTLLSSTSTSSAFWHSVFTSLSFSGSQRFSCSIQRSSSDCPACEGGRGKDAAPGSMRSGHAPADHVLLAGDETPLPPGPVCTAGGAAAGLQ